DHDGAGTAGRPGRDTPRRHGVDARLSQLHCGHRPFRSRCTVDHRSVGQPGTASGLPRVAGGPGRHREGAALDQGLQQSSRNGADRRIRTARQSTMMTVNDLAGLYDYGYWASKKLFAVMAQLTPEEFTRPVAGRVR